MIHLFDGVYVEQEQYIDVNFDRVLISKKNANSYVNISAGELLLAVPDFDSLLDLMSFSNFIEMLYVRYNLTGKKIVIYCDEELTVLFAHWCKHIFPQLDLSSFNRIVDFTNHNQSLANFGTPLKTETLAEVWNAVTVDNSCQTRLREMQLGYSYEFLMAEYVQGIETNLALFKKKFHYFLRKWFEEALTDNRLMILYNLYNHNFQKILKFTDKDVDVTSKNLLSRIPSMKYYSDETIWFRHGIDKVDISGLDQETVDGLRDTLLSVYRDCEHMQTNQTCFVLYQWLEVAVKDSITDAELEEIFECLMTNTFDTSGVPRHDFKTVNFPFLMFILKSKKDGNLELLTPYRLL